MALPSLWPPTTHDHPALLRAYTDLLGWPLLVNGHPATAEEAGCLLEAASEEQGRLPVVETSCAAFDAVVVPYDIGSEALVLLDRHRVRVPSLRHGRGPAGAVTFVVRAETATRDKITGLKCVRTVLTGGAERLVLPPSPRVRWDTPPWCPTAHEPLELPAAGALLAALHQASQLYRPLRR